MPSILITAIGLMLLYAILRWNTKNNSNKLYHRKGRNFKANYKAKKRDVFGDEDTKK